MISPAPGEYARVRLTLPPARRNTTNLLSACVGDSIRRLRPDQQALEQLPNELVLFHFLVAACSVSLASPRWSAHQHAVDALTHFVRAFFPTGGATINTMVYCIFTKILRLKPQGLLPSPPSPPLPPAAADVGVPAVQGRVGGGIYKHKC